MKYQDIRKRLIMETIVVVTCVVLLGGGAYYATLMTEEYEQEKRMLEGDIAAINGAINVMREKFAKVKDNARLYDEVATKSLHNELSIDRQAIRVRFDEFRNRYYLNNLSISMNPPEEVPGSRRATGSLLGSEVKITFEALTDADIYGLLDAMQKELPGAVKINEIRLSRDGQPTPEALQDLAKNGQYPLVRGEMALTWQGIQNTPPDAGGAEGNGSSDVQQ